MFILSAEFVLTNFITLTPSFFQKYMYYTFWLVFDLRRLVLSVPKYALLKTSHNKLHFFNSHNCVQ